jgi:hypothetical protein
MTPLTFEQAKQLVPEYIMLNAGVDVCKEGDEWYTFQTLFAEHMSWSLIFNSRVGQLCEVEIPTRRRIPDGVRGAMARIIIDGSMTLSVGNPFEWWLREQSQ